MNVTSDFGPSIRQLLPDLR